MSIEEFAQAPTAVLALFNSTPDVLKVPEFLEKLPLAIYACQADGRLLWFNSRAAKLWGRQPKVGDPSEKFYGSYKVFLGDRQIARDETPMASVLKTGIPVRGAEARVERPDGSSIWAMVHIEPVEDDDGNVAGAINCFHETTALHHASDELEDFFENAAVGLHLVSANGTILRANRAELAMLGYSADEYVGRNITEFHADPATIDDILSRLRRGEDLRSYPARLRVKDGSIRDVQITSNARVRDGAFINTRCFTIDVTDRLKAEELLRQHDDRLNATYQHAGIGIAEVDAEGRLLRVNPQLANYMGFAPEEILGRTIFDEALAEDAEQDRLQFVRQVAGEFDRYTIEKRIRRRQGGFFWAAITSSTVRDPQGSFLYAVRVQHDITDRKRAEEALSQRAREQEALFKFTDRLQHARAASDVYELALDAILRALRCDRASILLFDESDVMRFVAWRGLSDAYRQAVEGHSPWPRDAKNAEPVCFPDVANSELSNELKAVVAKEDIAAVAFIPVQEGGRLLGKFMAYYNAPHPFTPAEIELALTIARQLGFRLARRAAEAARCAAEREAQQLAAIVESCEDAIFGEDLAGIITSWNRGAERLYGYEAGEIVGKPVTILIPPEKYGEAAHLLARVREGERISHYETVRVRKDGTTLDVLLTVSPVLDPSGIIVGASKIARDITERKQALAKLRDSEYRLQQLLSAIPAAIYTTDADGKITYFNQAAVELAGRTPTLGSDEWCVTWKLYWPDGTPLPHDQCPMAIALKEGRPVRGYEAVAERPDGSRVPFIPYPTPLRDPVGNLVGAINMLVDISERKQAETQQHVLLNEMNHRVKNNLQTIQSLLYNGATQSRSPEARKVLDEAGGRIAAMAAAQRVLYGTFNATRFSAEEFIKVVCETARQTFPTDVHFHCEAAPGELPNDMAMPLALILNELITNAVKYGLEDGKGTVSVALTRNGDSFLLSVEDQGPGFDLETVRNRSSGLRLVQGLARQLRGRFEVTRTPTTRCNLYFS